MSDLIPQYAVQYEHPKTGKVLTLGNFPCAFDAADLVREVRKIAENVWTVERHVTKYQRIGA